jgi:octaprenyl-diphosphate synthase
LVLAASRTALQAERESAANAQAHNGLERLQALVADDLACVNRLIVDKMQSEVALIPQLAGHIVAAGGKRLRPLLTLATARLCGYAGTRHHALAACVEFIHTATLLHDDVVDESALRRGRATANAIWGNKASVLVGDFLFSRAFQLMVEDGSLEVLAILSNASAVIAEGEVQQLLTANDIETTVADYLKVIGAKTAALFDAACRIGAVVAERPAAEAEALGTFGQSLGMAFQLIDDLLDYTARETELGKTVGDDFREGKLTLPVVLAIERAQPAERAFWQRALEDLDQRDGDLEQAILLCERHGTLAETLALAGRYRDQALEALARFPASPLRETLEEVARFTVDRGY